MTVETDLLIDHKDPIAKLKAQLQDGDQQKQTDRDSDGLHFADSDRIEIQSGNALTRKIKFLAHLFSDKKFYVHRVVGMFYLVQWITSLFLYFYDFEWYNATWLPWTLPLTGLLQSTVAIMTFTFLPKNNYGSGYFTEKKAISYGFVVENSFYALLNVFHSTYFDDRFYNLYRNTVLFEAIMVFFPYFYRDLWPRTRFRDAYEVADSVDNVTFFKIGALVTKSFYIWAKHYIGFFLNYMRFLDRVTQEEMYHLKLMALFAGFSVTISLFLHTLKFKRYLEPRVAFLIYVGAYLATFYTYYCIFPVFFKHIDLALICLGGLVINFANRNVQLLYQIIVMGLLYGARFGELPDQLSFLYTGIKHSEL
ncbi:hypothetical protein MIR68_006967 [Amoeboaphelidium protococcarum]|nr:hypothetical protein MIR68_006967 [Amoeboaphelidium protococcarum]